MEAYFAGIAAVWLGVTIQHGIGPSLIVAGVMLSVGGIVLILDRK
jgi:hypothetical protein